MSVPSLSKPQPPFTGPVSVDQLLAHQPRARQVGTGLDEIRAGRRLVVLEDDPTSTQSITHLPVLTSWSVDDMRWALQQPTTAFFVLTNTRSLSADDAAKRNREVVRALAEASRLVGDVPYVIASRGDSTLRGYFPLETDVLAAELEDLRSTGRTRELEPDVLTLLEPNTRDRHVREVAAEAANLLQDSDSDSDVVIPPSRTLVTGADASESLLIARTVSAALVGTVREVVALVKPSFVLAKGGITSSDTATDGLAIRRAWSRGTMLPGIVSLWEPVTGPAQGIPYIVFAGNVGDDRALSAVVDTLRGA